MTVTKPIRSFGWVLLLMAALAQGCASIPKRHPVPQKSRATAQIPGMPDVRVWGDESVSYMAAWLGMPQEELKSRYPGVVGRAHHYLAISGGGERGAFAAG